MKRLLATGALLGAALMAPLLQGCLPMVAAGASGGALAVFDRRSLGTQTDDESIEWKVSARVGEKPWENVHANFTSYNRKVLITGEVPSEQVRIEIENIVTAVPQVQGLYNELSIGPVTSFSTRSNDSYITTRVKSRFVDSGKFNAVHVKVVTENGVVYLMGLVTQREADAAVQVARTTSDVRKVVTLFEIISDTKAKELDVSLPKSNPPAPPPTGGG
ncbi:MAG TPA: BON domain-containing protein [Candidatus Accumulibacter phosphatis]|nr:MAG: outer membrane lipoprotein [Candidatus Accumulibacter sp. SK-11]HAY29184.1 BON domain-containing protein [Accumulibacter sp.]HRL77975.1 BON domain-containing protein [Candidatus Accumulibacter phosphatis]HCN67434.1 BON domain-containing protein [Accumulibacter sp.]HCV14126.1 BON domain-containing protein [Accumulibacter sp.]